MSRFPPIGVNKPRKKPAPPASAPSTGEVPVPPPRPTTRADITAAVMRYHCLKDPAVEIPWILWAAAATPARMMLEVGTFQGATAAALALAFPSARIWTVDLPDPSAAIYNPQPRANTGIAFREMALDSVRQILCDSAQIASWPVRPERFDFAFVDGDHSEAVCRRDLHACADVLTPDGVIVAHDYTDENDQDRPEWTRSVHRAVSSFARARGLSVVRLPGWLVAIVDNPERLHRPACGTKTTNPVSCECGWR